MTKLHVEDTGLADQIRQYLRVSGIEVADETPVSITIAGDKKAPQLDESGSGLMTSGGRFAPGYDAKLKSALYRIIEGKPERIPPELAERGPMYVPLSEWTPEKAYAALDSYGWPHPVIHPPKPKKEKAEKVEGEETGQTKASRRRMNKAAQESAEAADEERAKEDDHAVV